MDQIGADLRKARLARGKSIEDISQSTKVSSSVLRAIESDEFHKVPGGLFTRGYLRAYAREVGLDAEEIVDRYRAEFEPPPPVEADRAQEAPRIHLAPEDREQLEKYWPVIELGIMGLITVVCFAFFLRPSSKPPAEIAAAPEPPAAHAPQEKSVATTGASDGVPTEIKVEMRATGPCWIEATSGSRRLVARLMNEGDKETVTVRDDVALRIGDPATLVFSIDGHPARTLGPGGKPMTVHLSPQNYKSLLAAQP